MNDLLKTHNPENMINSITNIKAEHNFRKTCFKLLFITQRFKPKMGLLLSSINFWVRIGLRMLFISIIIVDAKQEKRI